jgi:Uma2 family endonuclease
VQRNLPDDYLSAGKRGGFIDGSLIEIEVVMSVQMSAQLARKLITTAEYHQMIEAGVFDENNRIELIEGEFYEMFAIGPRHSATVIRLIELLIAQLKGIAMVSVQNPVELSQYSEPEPDITLLKRRADYYAESHPSPSDVLAVVEVADTSLQKDRSLKLPAYARAEIPEVWLIDLQNDRIEIHSQPGSGIYQEVRIVLRGQPVVSKAIPQLQLTADDILG